MTDLDTLRSGGVTQPAQIALRAGALTLVYEGGDLRYIRLGEREIVRRLYVAVRDQNWGTVAGSITDEHIAVGDDSFSISYTCEHRQHPIDYVWRATITGSADGTIRFQMEGQARATFLRNRIGFCVLHPIGALAGAACLVEHVDGSSEETVLPIAISPDQPVEPFAELRALRHEVAPGAWVVMRFEGDTFEMEDQRNWSDASLKTFCTPLRLPYPVEIAAGTRLRQSVELHVQAGRHDDAPTLAGEAYHTTIPPLVLSVDAGTALGALPALGLGAASHGQALSPRAIDRLRALCLAHMRVDLDLAAGDMAERLERAALEAAQLGVSLEVALLLPEAPGPALSALKAAITGLDLPVARWLVFQRDRQPTPDALVAAARAVLPQGQPIGAGSNSDFFFANRGPLPSAPFELLSFAINPQAHAFDNASLVETLQTQAVMVANARRLASGRPVVVSPVTLKPRFNPYATGDGPERAPGSLPPEVDVRQLSLFGAAWTLGSVKYLAEGGAASVTLFETTGWRGVMEVEQGAPMPEAFPSRPGQVFPLYLVLADVGDYAGAQVCSATSSDTLRLDGLALRRDGRVMVLLANLTPERQTASVRGLPGRVSARVLDEVTAEAALSDPDSFRAQPGALLATESGVLSLELRPYAVVRLVWEANE